MRLFIILVAAAGLAWGQAAQPLRQETTIELPDVQGRIDHMSIDVKGKRLFVSALGNNTVEVVDLKAGKRTKTIGQLKEPQGVLYVPKWGIHLTQVTTTCSVAVYGTGSGGLSPDSGGTRSSV